MALPKRSKRTGRFIKGGKKKKRKTKKRKTKRK
jgi:hypothetical protein